MRIAVMVILPVAVGGFAAAQTDGTADITAVLRQDAGVVLGASDLDNGTDVENLLRAALKVERAQGAQKGEFETTAEFKERFRQQFMAESGSLPARFVLLQAAQSGYDADTSTLTVQLPAELFRGRTVNRGVIVPSYGGNFPRDFLGADQPRQVVLPLPRDEARWIKPGLNWAIIARLPLAEAADKDSTPIVAQGGGAVAVAMLPLKGILFSKTDGRVLHRIDFVVPADVRVQGPDASVEDWLQASESTRRRVAARLFSGKDIEFTQLWIEVRGALERKQLSARDPVTALVRVPELPKLTAPIPVRQTRPKYPFDMRRAGIAGEVVVSFQVLENGKVSDVKAVRSTQREFEAAAIACVAEWTFRPATLAGRPSVVAMSVPIVFTLNEE